jgi:hypothetical protein
MKKLAYIFALLIISSAAQAQLKMGGITLPATIPAGKENLILNGGGVREKYMMDMYVGGLYLLSKSQDEKKIMDADELMAIKLHIVSGLITSDRMIEAVNEGFGKSTNNSTAALKTKIDKFIAIFKEPIKTGDIFDLIYIPGKGTVVFKNGKIKDSIEGLDFKKALFGIWLCSKPAQESLKTGMLGK